MALSTSMSVSPTRESTSTAAPRKFLLHFALAFPLTRSSSSRTQNQDEEIPRASAMVNQLSISHERYECTLGSVMDIDRVESGAPKLTKVAMRDAIERGFDRHVEDSTTCAPDFSTMRARRRMVSSGKAEPWGPSCAPMGSSTPSTSRKRKGAFASCLINDSLRSSLSWAWPCGQVASIVPEEQGTTAMLLADKAALQSDLAVEIMELQQRELALLTRNLQSIATQNALIAGFVFSVLVHGAPGAEECLKCTPLTSWSRVALWGGYVFCVVVAMSSSLLSLLVASLVSMLGPGLALRGPRGSMQVALRGMARYHGIIVSLAACALASMHAAAGLHVAIFYPIYLAAVAVPLLCLSLLLIFISVNKIKHDFFLLPALATNVTRFDSASSRLSVALDDVERLNGRTAPLHEVIAGRHHSTAWRGDSRSVARSTQHAAAELLRRIARSIEPSPPLPPAQATAGGSGRAPGRLEDEAQMSVTFGDERASLAVRGGKREAPQPPPRRHPPVDSRSTQGSRQLL